MALLIGSKIDCTEWELILGGWLVVAKINVEQLLSILEHYVSSKYNINYLTIIES
jgi:hypothetical protein